MEFVAQNWFYILALVLFVALHLVGPGCGHANRKRKHFTRSETDDRPSARDP